MITTAKTLREQALDISKELGHTEWSVKKGGRAFGCQFVEFHNRLTSDEPDLVALWNADGEYLGSEPV